MIGIKKYISVIALFSILFLWVADIAAQDIKLRIDAPESATINSEIRISYIIESNKPVNENYQVKEIDGFDILYGPSVSTSSFISTGKGGVRTSVYSKAFTYVVSPTRSGNIKIAKFEMTIDGKKYQSNSPSVQVSKSKDQTDTDNNTRRNNRIKPGRDSDNRQQDKIKAKIEKKINAAKIDAFIETLPSKSTVSPSDTLSITYRLYTTSEDFKVINADLPTSRDFYTQTYRSDSEGGQKQTIKGKTYFVYDLYKVILQPRSNGEKKFTGGSILLRYYIRTGERLTNMWGEEYEAIGEKEMELKIEVAPISVLSMVAT